MEDLRRRTGGCNIRSNAWRPLGKIPSKVKVSVQVDSNGSSAGSRLGVSVFTPAAVGRLIISNTIGIAEGDEDNSGGQSSLNLSIGVRLGTVCQANSVLVGVEKISNEEQKTVRTSSFTGMDHSIQVDPVRVGARSSIASYQASRDRCTIESFIRGRECWNSVNGGKTLQTAGDFVDVEDRSQRYGLSSHSSWSNGSTTVTVTGSNCKAIGLTTTVRNSGKPCSFFREKTSQGQEGCNCETAERGELHGCD